MMARILLIDDDAAVRTALAAILSGDGHAVATAIDGLDALHVLELVAIDLIITDVMMPNLDGIGFLRRVRKMQAPPPVIVISDGGRSPPDMYLDLAERLGAVALEKPVNLDELRRHITRLVGAPPA